MDSLARTLFDLSPAGIILFRPLFNAQRVLVDLAYEQLNPAAQQMLKQSERPAQTFRQLYPHAVETGIFGFFCAAFEREQASFYGVNYAYDGLDAYYQLAAQRTGELLAVTFTDTADRRRGDMALALRLSHQREQQARAEAERQRRELQRVFEQAPVAIAVYRGPRHVIELANPSVCALWGRQQQHIIGLPLFEALPEVAGMGYEELLHQVLTTGAPYVAHEMEAVHERHGRRDTVYWNFVYLPVHAEDGQISGVMVVATEVTAQVEARRQVEQLNQQLEARVHERTRQLETQQALLSQILGQVPAVVATLSGPGHHLSFFNAQYQTLVAGRAALGRPMVQAVPEAEEQGFVALLDQVYTSGQPYVGAERAVLLEQAVGPAQQQYLDLTCQPLTDGQGLVQGILVFAVDVTEQVRARRQAGTLQAAMLAVVRRQAQQRQDLYQLFEQTPAAIVLLREPDHRIDYFNPAFPRLFPPEEWAGPLQGQRIAHVYPRLRLTRLAALLDVVYRTGENQVLPDMPLAELQPGSPRYITFVYQPYREDGRVVGVAAFMHDVTEQVLARQQVHTLNQELLASNRQLTRTNADLDTFVYTASHDLKTPIANLEGLLLALRQDLPAELTATAPVARLLGLLDSSVGRFRQTIGHLTDIIRLQQASPEALEEVDLADLVQAVGLDLAPTVEATAARLTVDVAACPSLRQPASDLRAIVFNLLSNALKYRSPVRVPEVRLRATCTERQVVLTVQDNGLGLSAAQQSKLFGLFKRLHPHIEGSGVGLYATKKIVEKLGGTITVQSEPEVGSYFTVALPR